MFQATGKFNSKQKEKLRNENIFGLNIWCCPSKIKEKKETKQLREEQHVDLATKSVFSMMESAKLIMGTKAKEIVITRLNCAGEARERSQMTLDIMHKLLILTN